MEPAIGRSVREGLRAASRGWAGVGIYAGCWVLGIAFTAAPVVFTNFPTEILQEPTVAQPQPAIPQEAPAEAPAAVDPLDAQRQQDAQRDRAFSEWLGRAWPVLLLSFAFWLVVTVWLNGGQIGYLAALVREQQSRLSEFWTTGKRALGALLGVSGLSFLGIGGVALLFGLIIAAPAAAGASPGPLLAVMLFVAVIAFLVGMVWLGVRLAFWPLAVVIDRRGPIAGFASTFRATRGRWMQLFVLMVLFGLMGFGLWLVGALLEVAGRAVGGPVEVGIAIVSALALLTANLYLGFATLAALIRFYEDTKSIVPSGIGTVPNA